MRLKLWYGFAVREQISTKFRFEFFGGKIIEFMTAQIRVEIALATLRQVDSLRCLCCSCVCVAVSSARLVSYESQFTTE